MVVLACASSCLRRGEADASTTLLFLNSFNDGRFSGGGGPGGGLLPTGVCEGDLLCAMGDLRASSYDGGGSTGINCADMVGRKELIWLDSKVGSWHQLNAENLTTKSKCSSDVELAIAQRRSLCGSSRSEAQWPKLPAPPALTSFHMATLGPFNIN